jgi:2,4-dienoyl-CoA reductase (NADPH2)
MFAPLRLGTVELRNRIAMLPMGLRFTRDGAVTEDDVRFYEARAAGGVGLIITGGTVVAETSVARGRSRREAFRPELIHTFAALTKAIHRHGTRIVGQLLHVGEEWLGDADYVPIAASAQLRSPRNFLPRAMAEADIEALTESFVVSAANLLAASYDGIELHAGHGYLLGQFLSPARNHRDDRFGGSTAGRTEIVRGIAAAVRSRCGRDFPLGVRISAAEEIAGGLDLAESAEIAKLLAATGDVDYVSVAVGIRGSYVKDMSHPQASYRHLARAIRQASGLPVIASQRITRPEDAESIIADGDADLVGMARQLIADAEWANKAAHGWGRRIVPCVACVQECRSGGGGVSCMHNPVAGRERELSSLPVASRRSRVMIVGGGPAGLEAARIAAERGHRVALCERSPRLGGQARLAALAPYRDEMQNVVRFRELELSRLGVDVRLGRDVDADDPELLEADSVVVATGAVAPAVTLPVADASEVLTTWSALTVGDDVFAGRRVVVIDGGRSGWETYGAVHRAAAAGAAVTVVTSAGTVGVEIPGESIAPLMRSLQSLDVTFAVLTRAIRVDREGVHVRPAMAAAREAGGTQVLPASVIIAGGTPRPESALFARLSVRRGSVYAAGDCLSPRRLTHAVLEGHRVGRRL